MEHPHHSMVMTSDPGRLREEIAYVEARLAELGGDGDCAYENAMIRFFEQQLAARRDTLAVGAASSPRWESARGRASHSAQVG